MSENIIFCFSGTGNSLKVAKDIAKGVGDCDILPMTKAYEFKKDYKRIGFVYPVYCGGLPIAVENFIKNLKLPNREAYYFAICTCGGMQGGLFDISQYLLEKGTRLSYANYIKCFANYVCLYNLKDDPNAKANTQNQKIQPLIEDIKNSVKSNKFKKNIMSLIHNPMMKGFPDKDRYYNVNEDCDGCGICSKVCPVNNIEINENKPVFLHHCEQCVACIHWCPKKAINYKNKTQKRGRYHNPDISLADLINLADN